MSITVSTIESDLLPFLNAGSVSDLIWWSESELLRWVQETVQRIAREHSLFVERDENTSVAAGGSSYTLPARRISIIHVALDGARLEPTTVHDLMALSDTWPSDTGTPTRYTLDVAGLGIVTLYRQPTAGGTLAVVYHEWPELDSSGDTHRAPAAIADALMYEALAEARAKEGDAQDKGIAAAARVRAGLYGQAFRAYWGSAG